MCVCVKPIPTFTYSKCPRTSLTNKNNKNNENTLQAINTCNFCACTHWKSSDVSGDIDIQNREKQQSFAFCVPCSFLVRFNDFGYFGLPCLGTSVYMWYARLEPAQKAEIGIVFLVEKKFVRTMHGNETNIVCCTPTMMILTNEWRQVKTVNRMRNATVENSCVYVCLSITNSTNCWRS